MIITIVTVSINEHNVIIEKYDVQRRESQIRDGLKFGYTSNQIGFGWTNAVFLELYAGLPRQERSDRLLSVR